MKKGRMLPRWVSNVVLISVFVFCYLIIYCNVIALGYKVSTLEKQYQQMKNWNDYYRSQILKELSLEKVKQRAIKMNLSLEIPNQWRIVEITSSETETDNRNKNHAYGEERKQN
ncbi:MAG TPA: hypothetical protein PK303_05160 [bacterium]|nr:hypothetical protein [bacterium]HPP08494.1 hypothetical protein [bacterium]